jgi:hypothetical protein
MVVKLVTDSPRARRRKGGIAFSRSVADEASLIPFKPARLDTIR